MCTFIWPPHDRIMRILLLLHIRIIQQAVHVALPRVIPDALRVHVQRVRMAGFAVMIARVRKFLRTLQARGRIRVPAPHKPANQADLDAERRAARVANLFIIFSPTNQWEKNNHLILTPM